MSKQLEKAIKMQLGNIGEIEKFLKVVDFLSHCIYAKCGVDMPDNRKQEMLEHTHVIRRILYEQYQRIMHHALMFGGLSKEIEKKALRSLEWYTKEQHECMSLVDPNYRNGGYRSDDEKQFKQELKEAITKKKSK